MWSQQAWLNAVVTSIVQENYVEYSRLGNIIKGQERAVVKSRYEEDVHPNNHSVSGEGVGRRGG